VDLACAQLIGRVAVIDKILQRLQNWLSPPEYAQEYERIRRLREKGTAEWLFEEPSFQRLLEPDKEETRGTRIDERVLWVQGKNRMLTKGDDL
jgi:hypothetical protein